MLMPVGQDLGDILVADAALQDLAPWVNTYDACAERERVSEYCSVRLAL